MDLSSPTKRARFLLALLPMVVAITIAPAILGRSRTLYHPGPHATEEQDDAAEAARLKEDANRGNWVAGIMVTTVVGVTIAVSVLDKRDARRGRPKKQGEAAA